MMYQSPEVASLTVAKISSVSVQPNPRRTEVSRPRGWRSERNDCGLWL